MLGTILGASTSLEAMMKYVIKAWVDHVPEVRILSNGVFQLRFTILEDLEWVMKTGPWMLDGNKPLMLRRWEDGVRMDMRSFDKVPV